jgi:Ca2+-binding RTX toxin-like protein
MVEAALAGKTINTLVAPVSDSRAVETGGRIENETIEGIGFADSALPESLRDDQVEAIVPSSNSRINFLGRVFHEQGHSQQGHRWREAIDTSNGIAGVLADSIDFSDLADEHTYGAGIEMLRALGWTDEQIEREFGDDWQSAVDNIRSARNQVLADMVRALIDGTSTEQLTATQLDQLNDLGILRRLTRPPGYDEQVGGPWGSRLEHYELARRWREASALEHLANDIGLAVTGLADTIWDTFSEFVEDLGGALADATVSALRLDTSDLLGSIGTVLGRELAGDDPLAQIAVSSTLQSVLTNLGEWMEANGFPSDGPVAGGGLGDALEQALGGDLLATLEGQTVGAISSYLVGQLVEELGIEGVAGELTTSLGSRVMSQIATNLLHASDWVLNGQVVEAGTAGAVPRAWDFGITSAMFINAIGSWIGGRLALDVLDAETRGGQIGAAIGQTYGAINAAAFLARNPQWAAANPVLAVVVVAVIVFIDTITGGLIGSLFGGTPKAGAGLRWDANDQRFEVGHVWSKSGGSKDAVRYMAGTVGELLNGVIAASGSNVMDAAGIQAGAYDMKGKKFIYKASASSGYAFSSSDISKVVNHGAFIALYDLSERLIGGDVYIKRALSATLANANGNPDSNVAYAAGDFEVETLFGNVATAQDYASYLQNAAIVNALIAAEPESAFTAGWTITFARVIELGLDRRWKSDWLGGWAAFLDETAGGAIDGAAFAPANVFLELDPENNERLFVFVDEDGALLGALGDTIDTASKTIVEGTANGDTITVSNDSWSETRTVTETVAVAADRTFFNRRTNSIFTIPPETQFQGTPISLGDGLMLIGVDTVEVTREVTLDRTGWRITNAAGLSILNRDAEGGPAFATIASGPSEQIRVAAVIDGGGGDDTIRGGDLGNDLLGGAGNDTLVGGTLDDWLLGGDGNDRLFAGAATTTFAAGNATAENAAIAIDGGNGDYLEGGAGDDALYGGRGSDWLNGGAGVDRLLGGAGGDILAGGAGNERGANGEATVLGGAGSDQYVLGFGDGQDVIFDETDPASGVGGGDSFATRIANLLAGSVAQNWAGNGVYLENGDVRGGEDAIVFGPGVAVANLVMRRSGTTAAPGNDLIIQLQQVVNGVMTLTGDEITIKDWFSITRRVEWLRFADGEQIRIGDMTSFVAGTSGPDVIIGTYGSDFMVGGAGNDQIRGLAGNDFGFGGAGDDFVAGDGDNDLVSGGSGVDEVVGGAGNDTVFGDDGNDDLYGGAGNDILAGGLGDDQVVTGAGNDIIRFQRGDGRDTVIDEFVNNWDVVWQNGTYLNGYTLQSDGTVKLGATVVFDGTQWLGRYDWDDATKTLRRHKGAVSGVIAANAGADTIEFGVGIDIQDIVIRRVGNDLDLAISDGEGDARLFDEISDHVIVRDWYSVGASIEQFVFTEVGSIGGYTMTGGTDGNDTITLANVTNWATGGAGDDTIVGHNARDILVGGADNDILRAGVGYDILLGGAGNDLLDGGFHADQLIGGAGTDVASYASSTAAVTVNLTTSSSATGDAAGDVFSSIEGLEGSAYGDKLIGDAGANVLRGMVGADTLVGGVGDDAYEFEVGHGADIVRDGAFTYEQILDANGVFNSAQFTATWTRLSLTNAGGQYTHKYRLVITKTGTGEEVYRSRDNIDFIYVNYSSALLALPSGLGWPAGNGQWKAGFERTGNGAQTVREVLAAGEGGLDIVQFGAGVSLSDLTITRINGGADLLIAYGAGDSVTIQGQNNAERRVEAIQLQDGLSVDLINLRVAGEAGTADADTMLGDANANTLSGLAGNDIISGGAGVDTLSGGVGDDTLEGGAGADVLDGGTDSITDGAALTPGISDYGDTVRYVRSGAGVIVNLAASTVSGRDAAGNVSAVGDAHGDTIIGIENATGSDGYGDTLTGSAGANRLFGLGGNDTISGGDGDDVLVGGAGNDVLAGGNGEDALVGDDGIDTLTGGAGKDILNGGAGADSLNGDAGDDTLIAGDGNDTLHGGDDNDRVYGEDGDDTLYGDASDDEIVGGAGADIIYGGVGVDTIVGEVGADTLRGEAGNDIYAFDSASGADVVIDAEGTNKIVITDIPSTALWITRYGADLRITAIGYPAFSITISNYASANFIEIATADASLFLAYADLLITAMTAHSANAPAAMPTAIANSLTTYWDAGGEALPRVVDQDLTTVMGATLVGNVGAIDHDNNISGYAVAVAAAHGVVTLGAGGSWTYVPTAGYAGEDVFEIEVTDADNHIVRQTVSVFVLDPNQNYAPNAPTLTNQTLLTVQEGAVGGQVVATLSATDPNGTAPTLRIASDPGNLFEIVGNQVRFRAGASLTYAQVQTASVQIEAWDGALASSTTHTVNVGVLETNHAPTLAGQTVSVAENLPGAAQSVVATLAATDSDLSAANRNFRYQVLSGDTSVFSVDPITGQIRLQGALNYEGQQSYSLQVRVWDGGAFGAGMSSTATINFAVTNVNEAPSLALVSTTTGSGGLVGRVGGVDPEASAVTYIVEQAVVHFEIYSRSVEDTQPPSWVYEFIGNFSEDRTSAGGTMVNISSGNVYWVAPAINKLAYGGNWVQGEYYILTVRSRDTSGIMSAPMTLRVTSGAVMVAPIVLDLDSDGLELISIADSTIAFDMGQTGQAQRTGWVGADDGVLVFDRNANGTIDDGGEIAFSEDVDFAVSDLEGLRAYDTNEDGLFNAGDAQFASFAVWRDLNQDGVSQAGELNTLAQLGIESINLTLSPTGQSVAGAADNVVYGTTNFTRADGTIGTVGDVYLAYQDWTMVVEAAEGSGGPGQLPPIVFDLDGNGVQLISPTASSVLFDANDDGHRQRMGWFSAGDGVLAIDRNGDGVINSGSEISFRQDGALSDLEGLTAFDTNANGMIDAGDARYGELLVWRDQNQDGFSQSHEIASLAHYGIASINLTRGEVSLGNGDPSQNAVLATGSFTWRDGTAGALADVVLGYEGEDPAPPDDDGVRTADTRGRRRSRPWRGDDWINPRDRFAGNANSRDGFLSPFWARFDGRNDNDQDDAAPTPIADAANGFGGARSDVLSGVTAQHRSVLHRGLGVSDRRLLHMIDAMASFQPRGAADLARSSRHRDQKVAALLTSLPDGR